MGDYCLDLNEDQLTMQKWVHDFAENVIRPVASEYDEREETPWEVIQEAANIGLYSAEAVTSWFSDPTGLTFAMGNRQGRRFRITRAEIVRYYTADHPDVDPELVERAVDMFLAGDQLHVELL